MFTHLFVSKQDAAVIFDILGRKPLKPGQAGSAVRETFDLHFSEFSQSYIPAIDAIMVIDQLNNRVELQFRRYLAYVPQQLLELGIQILGAEIVRLNSAPTKARAGYYESEKDGFTAIVERSFPSRYEVPKVPVLAYVQNIRVNGPSLAAAQDFNTKLSIGAFNRFLVNAFE